MALPNELAKQLEEQGRYVLAAVLADGRRVLDIGRGHAQGLVILADAGAAALHARSSDPEGLQADLDAVGLEGVHVVGDVAWPLPYANGAFDLIVCHDVAERLSADARWEHELRRVLSADGYLLTAVANPNGQFVSEVGGQRFDTPIAYETLVGILQPHFNAITVFGQSPLVASLFFDFEDSSEETGLSLDRSLLPDADEQPGWFVMVFGPETCHRDDLAVVQLPFDSVIAAAATLGAGTDDAEESAEEENLVDDGAVLHGALEAEEQEEQYEEDAAPHSDTADTAERLIRSLEVELHLARTQVQAAHDAWLHARPTEDAAAKVALGQAQTYITKLERQLVGSQDVVAHLEVDLAQARQKLKAFEANAGETEATGTQVQALQAELETLRHDNARLMAVGQEIERSRHDRVNFETQIKDLLDEVAMLRKNEEGLQQETQGLREAVQHATARADNDKALWEHERASLEAEYTRARQASLPAVATMSPLARQHDAIGRELDTAVEELEDLLKDVAPPISSGR